MALPALVPPGDLLGNYKIVSKLASGGMGVVYKAYDVKLQRTVALKFLNGDGGLGTEDKERVLREARAASALDHENVGRIHAVEECHDGQLFIVMGYYEGENLAIRMSRSPLSIEQALEVARQVALGLGHAHSNNIIHRDIKPSNVILCPDGTAKIVDFGLARMESEDATQSLGVSGTLPYMSPEQVSGKQVDHRTDIWSLGVVMYELLVGRHPFQGESPGATVAAIAKALPPPMRELPIPLQMILYRTLSKLPEDRYQSCRELVHDLDACRNGADATVLVGEKDLKSRIKKAGLVEKKRFGTLARWSLVGLIVLAAIVVSSPVRNAWRGGRKAAAVKTTPAAYEIYQKGTQLLEVFYREHAIDSAIEEFNKALSADPNFALAYVGLGQAYYTNYRLLRDPKLIAEAEKNAKIALGLEPQLGDVYVLLGRIQLVLGNQGLALSQVQRAALELDPTSSQAHLALADVFTAMGRTNDAEGEYERGIALDPESWDGYYRRGMSYYPQQRYEEAAVQLRRALEIAPDNTYARTNLAVMLKELHRESEAEAELKKALEYREVYSAYGNLANLYYQQKRFPEAVDLTLKALRSNQTNYMLWNNLGVYYDAMGEKAKSADAYQHVFELLEKQVQMNPKDATMRSDIAMQYSKHNSGAKAVSHIRVALALQPKDKRILQIAGEIYYKLGQRTKALSYMRESVLRGNTLEELDRDPDLKSFISEQGVRKELQRTQLSMHSTAAKKTAN